MIRTALDILALCAIAGGLLYLAGCSADPIADQARAATVTAGVLTAGDEAATAAREVALAHVDATYPHDPEHDQQLDVVADRWRPLGIALDEARTALQAWIGALQVAHLAGGSEPLLRPVAVLGARAVQLIAHAFELASSLGVEHVPTMPPWLLTLANVAGGH